MKEAASQQEGSILQVVWHPPTVQKHQVDWSLVGVSVQLNGCFNGC